MGNITLTEPIKKQSSASHRPRLEKRHSPFREALSPKSPYYSNFSPIRYGERSYKKQNIKQSQRSIIIKSPISKEREFINSINQNQLQFYYKKQTQPNPKQIQSYDKKQQQLTDLSLQNKQKCKQIIKKVRNFNDFLFQLKKRLKNDNNNNTKNSQKSFKNIKDISPCNKNFNKTQRKQLSLCVKLQNEKLQLQKYKRLVQRQLSKTHSIQNIQIVNNFNGEQILTIQYQNIQNENVWIKKEDMIKQNCNRMSFQENNHDNKTNIESYNLDAQNPINIHKNKPLQLQTNMHKQSSYPQQQNSSSAPSKNQKLSQSKRLYTQMKIRTFQLQSKLQQQIAKNNLQKDKKPSCLSTLNDVDKTIRINQLYNMIYEVNLQSKEIEKRIKQLLN